MSTVSEEFRQKFPRLVANLVIAVVFTGISQIVSWVFKGINPDILFLLQIGLILAAGIFLVRGLFDALSVTDKVTKQLLKQVGIKKELSRQRIFKDTICIVAILLVAAAIVPIISNLSSSIPFLQEIITYSAMGLIALFVYDIGRTFYRITEKKANGLADRISNSIKEDETSAK
ncbi:MAG: hypothetical protein OQK81_02770 [Candidatus Bathyarchaeota archaeon]|nr:hypothetical protein [Candidatus Bathyarchaeota archaeon]